MFIMHSRIRIVYKDMSFAVELRRHHVRVVHAGAVDLASHFAQLESKCVDVGQSIVKERLTTGSRPPIEPGPS